MQKLEILYQCDKDNATIHTMHTVKLLHGHYNKWHTDKMNLLISVFSFDIFNNMECTFSSTSKSKTSIQLIYFNNKHNGICTEYTQKNLR